MFHTPVSEGRSGFLEMFCRDLKFFPPCLFLSLCIVLPVWGEWRLSSDFRASIHPSILADQIEKYFPREQQTEKFSFDDIRELRGETKIRVSGIRGEAEYTLTPFRYVGKRNSSLVWNAFSRSLGVFVMVDEIHAELEIEKKFNGGSVRVHLTATCNNIRLNLSKEKGASIAIGASSVVSGGYLHFTPEHATLSWPENAWQVDRMDCRGNEGFGVEVNKIMQEYVGRIKDSVQREFEARLKVYLREISKEFSEELLAYRLLFTNKDKSIKVNLKPEILDQSPNADIIVGGTLHGHAPKVFEGSSQKTERRFNSHRDLTSKQTEIQVPLSLLSDILLGSHIFELFGIEKRSSEIPAWQKLRQDRRAERFVFPDLGRFDIREEFLITGGSLYNPSLKNLRPSGVGRARGDFLFPLLVNIHAPRFGSFIPYVQFRGYIKGNASMRVTSDGRLELVIESSKTYLNYYWNQNYVERFRPNQNIEIDLISREIDKMLRGSNVHWELPHLELNQQKLSISSFSIGGDVIRIFWKRAIRSRIVN